MNSRVDSFKLWPLLLFYYYDLLCTCPYIYLSIYPSIRPSVCTFVYLSVCMSVYLSVHQSICRSIYICDYRYRLSLTADVFACHKENRKQIDTHTQKLSCDQWEHARKQEHIWVLLPRVHPLKNSSSVFVLMLCRSPPSSPAVACLFQMLVSCELWDRRLAFCILQGLVSSACISKGAFTKKGLWWFNCDEMRWSWETCFFFIFNFFSITKPIRLGQSGCCYDDICRWPQSGWSESWF